MKEKVVLFDWGNIVESFTTGYSIKNAFNDLFKSLGYEGENIFQEVGKYQLTKLKSMEELEECYEKMKNDYNLNKDFDYFLKKYKYYFDQITYYKDVRDYEISLKDRCYIGILSNLIIIDRERIDKQLGLDNYDYLFFSYEYGMRKPDINFYKKIQEKLPFKKEDILFLDDKEKNVETAREFGWNSYVVTGLELDKIKKYVEDFLSEVSK